MAVVVILTAAVPRLPPLVLAIAPPRTIGGKQAGRRAATLVAVAGGDERAPAYNIPYWVWARTELPKVGGGLTVIVEVTDQ